MVHRGADAAVDLDRRAVGAEVGRCGPVVGDRVVGDLGVVALDHHSDGAVVVERAGGVGSHPVVVVQVVAQDLGATGVLGDVDAVDVVGGLDVGDHVAGAVGPDSVGGAVGHGEVGHRDERPADLEAVAGHDRLAARAVGADGDRGPTGAGAPDGELAGEGGAALQEHLVTRVELETGGPAERLDGTAGGGAVVGVGAGGRDVVRRTSGGLRGGLGECQRGGGRGDGENRQSCGDAEVGGHRGPSRGVCGPSSVGRRGNGRGFTYGGPVGGP